MSEKTAQSIKDRLIKIYGSGLAVFIGVFAFISALVLFLSYLK